MSAHPYENAENINKDLSITTEAVYNDEDRNFMSGAFMVTVWYDEKPIGQDITEEFGNIGTWLCYDFHAPANAEEIQTAIQAARDNALTAARYRLKAEVEAIQSGQREAELFAAVTALNTLSEAAPKLTAEQTAAITERHEESKVAERLETAADLWDYIRDSRDFTRYADEMGSYYFSSNTMSFFHTRIIQGVKRDDNHVYMRISDVNWNNETVYSIVRMNIAGKIEKITEAEHLPSEDAMNEVWNSL